MKLLFFKYLRFFFLRVTLTSLTVACFSFSYSQIRLERSFGEHISPKSIVHDGRGLFSAQNMMYRHSITLYSSNGNLLKTISDEVNLKQFGFSEYKDVSYKGAPVEACFTPNGKYLWVSNYAMYGPEFNREGCDGCSGDHYDPSFLYKINTLNYEIESVVKVGSVPKFLTISNNGKLLLVSNWTSSDVSIIDLETEKEIRRVKVGPRPRGIVIDKWNQKAYVAIMGSDKIAEINMLNFSVNYINSLGKAPRHLILNKDNTLLYVAINSANKLAKINLSNKSIQYCQTKSGPRSMILSPDENYLYVVNYHANSFQKIDAKNMAVIATKSTMQKPVGIAADWKHGNIWVSCYSGKIQIFHDLSSINAKDLTTDQEVHLPKIKLAGLLLSMMEIPPMESEAISFSEEELKAGTGNKSITDEPKNAAVTNTSENAHLKYNVIVGSFSVLENAKHMQALLLTQGISSTLVPSASKNMTMVSAGQFTNSRSASNLVRSLKSEHDLSAWIYEKHN